MNPCIDCGLEDNLTYCCKANPETKEVCTLKLSDGSVVEACPNLNESGLCSDYENRPEDCIDYHCHKFHECDLFDLLYD